MINFPLNDHILYIVQHCDPLPAGIISLDSYNIPPESPFSPKSPQTIRAMENFHVSRGWLMSQNGPTLSALPSLYCQVMLKEYHVTDAVREILLLL